MVCSCFIINSTPSMLIHPIQARLVESGAKKLTQFLYQVVAEGSSGATPIPGSEMMMTSPSMLIPKLAPVVSFLRTLPLPSTQLSHPSASAILSTLNETQKCLEGQGKRFVARAETIGPRSLTTGKESTGGVDLMFGGMRCRIVVCRTLIICVTGRMQVFERSWFFVKLVKPQVVASADRILMASILKLFSSSVLTQLLTGVKKSFTQIRLPRVVSI